MFSRLTKGLHGTALSLMIPASRGKFLKDIPEIAEKAAVRPGWYGPEGLLCSAIECCNRNQPGKVFIHFVQKGPHTQD